MKTLRTSTNFLNLDLHLNIGSATDAYLRELALLDIQSRYLAHTVDQPSAYERSLMGAAEELKGKYIEGCYLSPTTAP